MNMRKNFYILIGIFMAIAYSTDMEAKQWTLSECINYALQNNISLQKNILSRQAAQEDLLQSKSSLLPSLDLSLSQNGVYRPWQESGTATVSNGYVQNSVNKFYYAGSYGINANWTVWNGNRNTNTIKYNKLAEEQSALDSATTANNIQEQIAQLYIQILYSTEATKVYQESLELSKTNEKRGKEMVEVGKMSKADLAQLSAQRAQDEYNIVAAESLTRNYKRQLKKLLEITDDEDFDIVIPSATDEQALQIIPTIQDVYTTALNIRPEIRNSKLAVESSDLNIKIAKGQRMPTIGVNAGVGTNTTNMDDTAWGSQMKTNLDAMVGISVSIPLFDNRSSKTAINKARIQRQNNLLDLKDKQTSLHSTIEDYWLQATTNQNQFKAAQKSVESEQASYDLLSEQFRLGLKNIIELMTGKVNLLTAKQKELQSKYLTILNIDMLKFYQNGELK